MPYVVDASIAACWHYVDEHDARAITALDRLEHDSAVAPLHWWFELRNLLIIGERRRRTSELESVRFLQKLANLPITFAPLPPEAAVFSLARKHRLTFYDAAYLELARRQRIDLGTLDGALIEAARKEDVQVIM